MHVGYLGDLSIRGGLGRAEDSPPVMRLRLTLKTKLVWACTLAAQSGEYLHLHGLFSWIDLVSENRSNSCTLL